MRTVASVNVKARNDMQIEGLVMFLKAQQEAEEKGEHKFTCPNCKGVAWWDRAKTNGHIRIRCNGCGMTVME